MRVKRHRGLELGSLASVQIPYLALIDARRRVVAYTFQYLQDENSVPICNRGAEMLPRLHWRVLAK